MARIAITLSALVCALGAIGVFSPTTLLGIARQLASPIGLIIAAAIRVGFGAILLLSASTSRAPRAIRIVGLIILVAGLITPFFGVDRARALLDWWSVQGPLLTRILPGFALAFGSGLIYLLSPRSRVANKDLS